VPGALPVEGRGKTLFPTGEGKSCWWSEHLVDLLRDERNDLYGQGGGLIPHAAGGEGLRRGGGKGAQWKLFIMTCGRPCQGSGEGSPYYREFAKRGREDRVGAGKFAGVLWRWPGNPEGRSFPARNSFLGEPWGGRISCTRSIRLRRTQENSGRKKGNQVDSRGLRLHNVTSQTGEDRCQSRQPSRGGKGGPEKKSSHRSQKKKGQRPARKKKTPVGTAFFMSGALAPDQKKKER